MIKEYSFKPAYIFKTILFIALIQTLKIFLLLQCLDVCPEGTYGLNCQQKCACQNGAKCIPKDGSCLCSKGWRGKNCTKRVCPDWLFGPNCDQACQCEKANTEM